MTANAVSPRVLGGSSITTPFPTLDEIKKKLGIDPADTSLDQALVDIVNATVAMIETYLGRGIAFARVTQEFGTIDTRDAKLFLHRYPVGQVYSVTIDGQIEPATSYLVYKPPGILQWRDGCGCARRASCCERDPIVLVDYDGGYPDDAWPPDLSEAVMRAFYGRWQSVAGSVGNVPPTGSWPVKSWSADGLAITYDTATQPGLGPDLTSGSIPLDLMPIAAMIDGYRSRRVPGA